MMDAMAGNQLGDQTKCTNFHYNCSVRWRCNLDDECPFYNFFFHRRAGSAISGLSSKLLPSSLARRLLLDKVYWTFTIILMFEDDLGSSIQFHTLIHTTTFKLRANNQHLYWVNPTVADLRHVWHMALVSLHAIDHDIWHRKWPWIMSPISEIDSHK